MSGFTELLRSNRNYRFTWIGQVVSEVGDHYNNIAVFSLVLANTGSGLVVAGILLARGAAVMLGGPIAGVLLDRMDRKRLMITSDLVRAGIALLFIFGIPKGHTWLLYVLSGGLMFASPFFTSGRAAILPSIANKDELHTANSLTQLTQWSTLVIGAFLGGTSVAGFGYTLAFAFNAFSFLFSALCISRLHGPGGFRSDRSALTESQRRPAVARIHRRPALHAGDAADSGDRTGGGRLGHRRRGGADSVQHFRRSGFPARADRDRHHLGMRGHRPGVRGALCELHRQTHSVRIVQARDFGVLRGPRRILRSVQPGADVRGRAVVHRAVARGCGRQLGAEYVAASAARLERLPGRVFSTIETWTWATMMVSMAIAGLLSDHVSPRTIGLWAGVLSSTTAIFWGWGNLSGKLPEPTLAGVEPEEVEVHGDPTV